MRQPFVALPTAYRLGPSVSTLPLEQTLAAR
jgi:hypothetical protein